MKPPPVTTALSKSAPVNARLFDDAAVEAVFALAAVGVTDWRAAEGGPAPAELIAATVNVYGVPLVSPVTVYVVTLPTVTGDPLEGVMT